MNDDLRLVILKSFKEVGELVNKHLQKIRNTNTNYIVEAEETRFNNGEGKIKLLETIRNKDVYIISDVGNCSVTYNMYDYVNHKSPDDHFQDIKRVIYAVRSHSRKNSVMMPLLYASRQHRRNGRESLDCASALQDLVYLGVENILTFDVHDVDIQNAIPKSSFESFYPTKELVADFLEKEDVDFTNMFSIAPDTGAMGRANLFANLFKCNLGFFRKERDTSIVIDGKNPIINHQYVGPSLEGKNVLVTDDMIASGSSILDVAHEAKKRGADKIYLFATFSLFTEGIDMFDKSYAEGNFDAIYTTNLTYCSSRYKRDWLNIVDCSYKIAQIIDNLNRGISLSPLLNESDVIDKMIQEKIKNGRY